jgi:hypothetical protein
LGNTQLGCARDRDNSGGSGGGLRRLSTADLHHHGWMTHWSLDADWKLVEDAVLSHRDTLTTLLWGPDALYSELAVSASYEKRFPRLPQLRHLKVLQMPLDNLYADWRNLSALRLGDLIPASVMDLTLIERWLQDDPPELETLGYRQNVHDALVEYVEEQTGGAGPLERLTFRPSRFVEHEFGPVEMEERQRAGVVDDELEWRRGGGRDARVVFGCLLVDAAMDFL